MGLWLNPSPGLDGHTAPVLLCCHLPSCPTRGHPGQGSPSSTPHLEEQRDPDLAVPLLDPAAQTMRSKEQNLRLLPMARGGAGSEPGARAAGDKWDRE